MTKKSVDKRQLDCQSDHMAVRVLEDGSVEGNIQFRFEGEFPDEVVPTINYLEAQDGNITFNFPKPENSENWQVESDDFESYEEWYEGVDYVTDKIGDANVTLFGEFMYAAMMIDSEGETDKMVQVLERLLRQTPSDQEVTVTIEEKQ